MIIIAVYDLFKDAFLATQALAGSYIQLSGLWNARGKMDGWTTYLHRPNDKL